MAAFASLLGDSLVGAGLEQQSTAAALEGKSAVALYFSAHWCPPCRGFTPKLAEWYRKDLKGKGLEVVFVSSDQDEGSFKEYFAEQPWLALPFGDRAKKESLSKKFRVRGIPSLVILDSEARTITVDGRAAVSKDPTGESFPWKPRPLNELLGQAKLVGQSGDCVTVQQAMAGKKALALYFSAHWCPPCRGFTPKLAEWYRKDLKGKGLEVVFVSSDQDEGSFKEYFAEQPWLALDYADRALKETLSESLKVQGIPTLVILDADLNVVTTEGRGAVSADPEGREMPWRPRPVKNLNDGPGDINEVPTLVAFCEDSGPEEQRALELVLEPIAVRYIEQEKRTGDTLELAIAMATERESLASKVRETLKISLADGERAAPRLAILDISDNGGYYLWAVDAAVTAASVEEFIAGYKGGKLERMQISQDSSPPNSRQKKQQCCVLS